MIKEYKLSLISESRIRHTPAIELLKAGVPVAVVQDLLGHSALTTTAIYHRISGYEAKEILRQKVLFKNFFFKNIYVLIELSRYIQKNILSC